jgi:hypothetical protein
VDEQAAIRARELNQIQNVTFLKSKPAIQPAHTLICFRISINSLIFKMVAGEWYLFHSNRKQVSLVAIFLAKMATYQII